MTKAEKNNHETIKDVAVDLSSKRSWEVAIDFDDLVEAGADVNDLAKMLQKAHYTPYVIKGLIESSTPENINDLVGHLRPEFVAFFADDLREHGASIDSNISSRKYNSFEQEVFRPELKEMIEYVDKKLDGFDASQISNEHDLITSLSAILGIENAPTIQHINDIDEEDAEFFDAEQNAVIINDAKSTTVGDSLGLANVVAHEVWHAYQHQLANLLLLNNHLY